MDEFPFQSQMLPHCMPSDNPMRSAWFGLGLDFKHYNAMDNEIVSTLAASWETHRRLKMAASTVQGALTALGFLQDQVELYGSLSMGRTEPHRPPPEPPAPCRRDGPEAR